MAKRKVPGLGKSKGMQSDFPVFPAGKYVLQIEKWSEKDSKTGTATIHSFQMRCLEALSEGQGQEEMVDKVYFHRLIEMHEDHQSYEQWGHLFVDELKSMLDAASITVKADSIDMEEFVDKTLVATIKVTDEKDEEGNPRKGNRVSKWEADEQ